MITTLNCAATRARCSAIFLESFWHREHPPCRRPIFHSEGQIGRLCLGHSLSSGAGTGSLRCPCRLFRGRRLVYRSYPHSQQPVVLKPFLQFDGDIGLLCFRQGRSTAGGRAYDAHSLVVRSSHLTKSLSNSTAVKERSSILRAWHPSQTKLGKRSRDLYRIPRRARNALQLDSGDSDISKSNFVDPGSCDRTRIAGLRRSSVVVIDFDRSPRRKSEGEKSPMYRQNYRRRCELR